MPRTITEGLAVVDVDSHWVEPAELWVERAPARFKDRVPHLVADPDSDRDVWLVDGTVMSGYSFTVITNGGDKVFGTTTITRAAEADPSGSYAKPRLAMMDKLGLSGQVMFPNAIGFGAVDLLTNVADPELRNLCASLYNDAVADLQAEGEGRLFPQAIVPFWDIDAAVASVARTRQLGLHGMVMCDSPEMIGIGLPPLHDPHWAPLWDALQGEGLPVSFHVGSGKGRTRCVEACWPGYPMAEFMTLMPAELFLSNSATIGNLIISGLCERYPRLRFFSVESGVGYLPFYLQALDYQYVEGGLDVTGRLPLLPSEYFRRQIYCSFWFETYGVAEAIRFLGNDHVMFETDFPHPSCLYPGTAARVDALAEALDIETLERVLFRNATDLFDLPELAPVDRELAVR